MFTASSGRRANRNRCINIIALAVIWILENLIASYTVCVSCGSFPLPRTYRKHKDQRSDYWAQQSIPRVIQTLTVHIHCQLPYYMRIIHNVLCCRYLNEYAGFYINHLKATINKIMREEMVNAQMQLCVLEMNPAHSPMCVILIQIPTRLQDCLFDGTPHLSRTGMAFLYSSHAPFSLDAAVD